jgi:hypothetical protein
MGRQQHPATFENTYITVMMMRGLRAVKSWASRLHPATRNFNQPSLIIDDDMVK